ncbi:MAG: hypothetical protein JNG90_18665 [Planctomycetaceae bacterium]|nr:hypothetical protein [Planctomycetaceae bacterium]
MLALALSLAAGNLWFTAARSTIPLELRGMVFDREIRHEKHPGADDVHFIVMDNGRRLHVDQAVYEALNQGDLVEKRRFERQLIVKPVTGTIQGLDLVPSDEHRGMHVVMPVALGVALALALFAWDALARSSRAAESAAQTGRP